MDGWLDDLYLNTIKIKATSLWGRVGNLLDAKTRTFVNKIKAGDSGKRKQGKNAETWMKLSIYL